MDSGADNIILGNDIATFLNIDLTKAPKFPTEVVGGKNISIKRHKIDIIFEGRKFPLTADFSDSHKFPILGRIFFEKFASVIFKEPEKIIELVLPTTKN